MAWSQYTKRWLEEKCLIAKFLMAGFAKLLAKNIDDNVCLFFNGY